MFADKLDKLFGKTPSVFDFRFKGAMSTINNFLGVFQCLQEDFDQYLDRWEETSGLDSQRQSGT